MSEIYESVARFACEVDVADDTVWTRSAIISAPQAAIASLADDVSTLANLEELPGHGNVVRIAEKD